MIILKDNRTNRIWIPLGRGAIEDNFGHSNLAGKRFATGFIIDRLGKAV